MSRDVKQEDLLIENGSGIKADDQSFAAEIEKALRLKAEHSDSDIIEILTSRQNDLDSVSSSSGGEMIQLVVKKHRGFPGRRGKRSRDVDPPYEGDLPPACFHCSACSTPQWRYIHRDRYCNACYMRVKRYVTNKKCPEGLPARFKDILSADEDQRLTDQARDIVRKAFSEPSV